MLTAVILAKNESSRLPGCLKSLSFCDRLLVIDDCSTDATPRVAKNFGASVIRHALNGSFASARNFALTHIPSGWVLFIDADEIVSPILASEILTVVSAASPPKSFYMTRIDVLWGRVMWHGDNRAQLLRLAPVDAGKWSGQVHETWQVAGPTAFLTAPLLHYPHPSLVEFLTSLNTYSTYRAQELCNDHKTATFWSITFLPILKFIHLYFFKLGFLDGTAGLISAMLMAFHTFLVRGKLYLQCPK